MREIEAYREELEIVFREASEEMAELPAALGERGQALLALSHPLRNGGRGNRISYLLPYWMQDQTRSPIELCRDLAVGNIYAMLRYFLLDDAMDGKERRPEGIRGALALGQLLEELFRRRYLRHFPADSMLWERYRRYVGEWASAVDTEMANPIDPNDFGQLARKAAPVKIGASGLLLHAGMPDRIPDAERAVDLALAALQLSDDWADWRDDLPDPNGNAFLSIVSSGLPPFTVLDERAVRTAIYHHHAADRLADMAERCVEQLKQVPYAPDRLAAFAAAVAQGIRREARHIEESRVSLAAEGGFSQLLSKMRRS
ncbi:hypothetical protein [Cohnella sp. REN36]|uniref:hypothetical protein n=1 Tax=Cohnella sp. REN36 TaxID=2887347 RepID=UPI001D140DBB|nr:hypothetical protein [Cohnella sp. REN36]MCC3374247.1 hypothetical protein [Cohnella sp. REN36]